MKEKLFQKRQEFIKKSSLGLGTLAFNSVLGQADTSNPQSKRIKHHHAKAKHVIFLYMDGGVSQVDSFDYKPKLKELDGQEPKFKVDATVFNNNGHILSSQWDYKPRGKSGLLISDLFPHIGSCADDLCIVNSMTAFSPNHPNANYALHSGHALLGHPSMGAWVSYGIGSENHNLPAFAVLHGGQVPSGGMSCFGSGYLSAIHAGSVFSMKDPAMKNTKRLEQSQKLQIAKLKQLTEIDRQLYEQYGYAQQLESSMKNYELAYRMQEEVPDVMDISSESEATKKLYGFDSEFDKTKEYAKQCLIARRLVERGVRFIELTIPKVRGDRWDQHSNLIQGHSDNARMVDQPIAGLIKDLKSRGLFEETLIVFSGEFGRTPFVQGKNGRDHNPQGFSLWMAGGGIKGGMNYGSTDEYGYRVIEHKCTVHDLHANMLHLLGIDHERLTIRHSGRDIRLTDVHGEILHDILA